MAPATNGGTEFEPAALDRIEKRFWRDVWDAVPASVAAEHGVLREDFGPLQATIAAGEPAVPMLNLILDAAIDRAPEGHLAAAVEWARGHGVRANVPVPPDLPGSEAAAGWLEDNGFAPRPEWMRFVRDPHPPRFEVPAGVEVIEVGGEGDRADGGGSGTAARRGDAGPRRALPFAAIAATAFELPAWTAGLFAGLPGRPGWRCYVALVDDEPQAGAAMLLDGGVAELGIAATLAGGRRRGCQPALLGRRIEDAAAAGADTLFAETGARVPGRPSTSYGNLLRAGFEEAYPCPGWIDARPAAD